MSSFHFPTRLLFLSLFTFLCFSNATLSYPPTNIGSIKSTETELNEICSQTDDPTACLEFFRFRAESNECSLKELCGLGLILGIELAEQAQVRVELAAVIEGDPELKDKYKFCAKNYNIILYKFGTDARRGVQSGNFDVVKSAASEAYNYTTRCTKLLTADSVRGRESRFTGAIAQAVVIIANKLLPARSNISKK